MHYLLFLDRIVPRREMNNMSLVEVKNLKKVYTSKLGTNGVVALRDVNFSVERGEYVAVMGESGLDGMNLSAIRDGEISAFRRDNLGFVFQDFNLLDTFTLRDNIYLPRVLAGAKPSQMEAELKLIAEYLGITHILDKFPYEVSGGQKQRAAVARALITNPRLILADEPTGALDSKTGIEIMQLLKKLNAEKGKTILLITHDANVAEYANQTIRIKDGLFV